MTTPNTVTFDIEQGLIALPGAPARWIWAFTCPTPKCGCRAAVVVSAPGDRETLRERGRPVADAWQGHANYSQTAEALQGVAAFAVDLDTRQLLPAVGDAPLDASVHPEVREVADRLDDDVLDAIARLWHLGKGEPLPPDPQGKAAIEVDGWRPGGRVGWEEAQPSLRADTYRFGERIFDAFELYCVEPDCDCQHVVVDFSVLVPRGAPRPGLVEFDGEAGILHPDHERQRERLTELWAAYCARHPRYRERLAQRSATMHGLAGRFVAAPPKPKVGRNEACPCGSGKKYKKCCGTV